MRVWAFRKTLELSTIILLVTFFVVGSTAPVTIAGNSCTSGWYVTGYYTPHESDFSGNLIQIQAEGQSLQVKEDFIDEVKIEGWGKLESGEYLGWYDSMYHLSPDPLDAHDTALSETSLAADPNVLPQGTMVYIPTLPFPYDQIIFTITDVGPSINGQHVDVYTGEGQTAYQDTLDITGFNNTVCVIDDQDIDGDGVANEDDNCPNIANLGQEDFDNDGKGDVCDRFCKKPFSFYDTITYGTNGNDNLLGTDGRDIILALKGDDTVSGGKKRDCIIGGGGKDTLNGDRGNDRIFGERHKDVINSGNGNDVVKGNNGDDTINCGGGNNDSADGGAGTDTAVNCEVTSNIP